MSIVTFAETNLALAASRLRRAHNEVEFLKRIDQADTSTMIFAQQELRLAKANHATILSKLATEVSTLDYQDRLHLCNVARSAGFALSA